MCLHMPYSGPNSTAFQPCLPNTPVHPGIDGLPSPTPALPQMLQNSNANSKSRLILEHTIAGRAVFYCVFPKSPDAKPPTFGTKNRLRAHGPKLELHQSVDIEPSAKVPYIDALTEHSITWQAPAEPPVREGASLQRASAPASQASAKSRPERPIHLYREEKVPK